MDGCTGAVLSLPREVETHPANKAKFYKSAQNLWQGRSLKLFPITNQLNEDETKLYPNNQCILCFTMPFSLPLSKYLICF